jgi:hypothetical protein
MTNGRHIEVWRIRDETEIEETINEYCRKWEYIPVSVSVTYSIRKDLWVVALLVESKGGE